jgi:Family of unknown function (DUF6194)
MTYGRAGRPPARTGLRDVATAMPSEDVLGELLALDAAMTLQRYYGERGVFYNPGRAAPLGVIVASVKDHDGPHDRRANLSRPDVYRLAFGLTRTTFAELFGDVPARPPKGRAVALPDHDLAALDQLMPHPVYAWMSWVQILNPTTERFDSLRDLLTGSLDLARDKWRRRRG